MRSLLVALGCLVFVSGCAVAVDDSSDFGSPGGKADAASGALEGARAGYAVLRLLNDGEGSTAAFLDDEVRLDRRAAYNLVAHRDGADGAFGTRDDDLFDTISEVDDVSWVGPAALSTLAEFARLNDYLPGDNETLGTFDGVEFTFLEGERVLEFVNAATTEELGAASVPTRALGPILEARPFATLDALAATYWVGPRTLESLRDRFSQPAEAPACETSADCEAGTQCVGRPYAYPYGKCRDTRSVPGQSDECAAESECSGALVCIGLTISGTGYCSPSWMRESFAAGTTGGLPAVPMSEPTGFGLTVIGLATVPMDVSVDLDIEHTHPQNLWIGLQPPTGQEPVTLWDGATMTGPIPNHIVDYSVERDNEVNGEWILLIQNSTGIGEGTFRGYTLNLSSRWD